MRATAGACLSRLAAAQSRETIVGAAVAMQQLQWEHFHEFLDAKGESERRGKRTDRLIRARQTQLQYANAARLLGAMVKGDS